MNNKKIHYNNLLSNYNFITQRIENKFKQLKTMHTNFNDKRQLFCNATDIEILNSIDKLKIEKIKTELQLKDFKFNNEVVK